VKTREAIRGGPALATERAFLHRKIRKGGNAYRSSEKRCPRDRERWRADYLTGDQLEKGGGTIKRKEKRRRGKKRKTCVHAVEGGGTKRSRNKENVRRDQWKRKKKKEYEECVTEENALEVAEYKN